MAMKYKRLWGPPICVTIKVPLENTSSLTWKVKKIKNKSTNHTYTKMPHYSLKEKKKTYLQYQIHQGNIIPRISNSKSQAWNDKLYALKWKNCQSLLWYPAKISFKVYTEIKILQIKYNVKQFISVKPVLQKMLTDILHTVKEERASQHKNLGRSESYGKNALINGD